MTWISREELAVTLVCAGKVGRQEESPGWRTAGLARGQWRKTGGQGSGQWRKTGGQGSGQWRKSKGQRKIHLRKTRGQERTVEEELRPENGSGG